MAQKKRLGKDPFISSAPADPGVTVPPAEETKIKTARAKKPNTTGKAVAAAPIAAVSSVEKAPAEPKAANPARNAEIESIKQELAELQAMVLKLQQQLDAINPWNEYFFSPWQWWFSFFS